MRTPARTSLRRALAALVLPLLAACASTPVDTPPLEFLRKAAGQRVYGMVVDVGMVPDKDVDASPVCAQRDQACTRAILEQSNQYIWVAVLGTNTFPRVLVPRSMNFQPGDIVQLEVSQDPARPATYIELGARSAQRTPACNWVDGSLPTRRGGVVCNGWSYKSLL